MRAAPAHADLDTVAALVREHGVVAVIDEVLQRLADAPAGVLIGDPLVERAMADATRLDASSSARRPLRGVPFVVKDNIDVAGVLTTAACPGFSYVAGRDAAVVARLRAAGAIVVGKANLDQFATGLVGTRSPYGTPPNALDGRLAPGGSSSGSAVAVALGLVPFALGTDTAGSGRVPAALNGIVGWKPTVGRYDTAGVVPAVRRLDCPSVFARTVADASSVAAAMETSRRPPAAPDPAARNPTIGVPRRWPIDVEIDPVVEAAFAESIERLASSGATIRPIEIGPLLELGRMLYGSALVAERALAVGGAVAAGVEGLDAVVAGVIRQGFALSAVDAYRCEYELAERRAAASAALVPVDVLALPTTLFAPTLDEVARDPIGVNERLGTLTTFVNLLARPAVVIPIGGSAPVGLQLIAAPGRDAELTALAAAISGA